MRFWDSSAIITLIVAEAATAAAQDALRHDPSMMAWWAAELECVSALSRLERDGDLAPEKAEEAGERLSALAGSWHEVQPTEPVRRTAKRLLRLHPLRTADSLQLAAALVASEGDPGTLGFISLDARLVTAARKEGLTLVDL